MSQVIAAIYEDGVLKPLQRLDLADRTQVRITVEPLPASGSTKQGPADDPLEDLRVHTGVPDLAENFGNYQFGSRRKEQQ